MIRKIKQIIRPFVRKPIRSNMPIYWIKQNDESWLYKIFSNNCLAPSATVYNNKIEMLADMTNNLGAQPLWEGYAGNNVGGPTRLPNVVRTSPAMGELYTCLVTELKPKIIVEFGTAFGVSGMYFLAGININNNGVLLTFEPNDIWAKIADNNLSQISDQYQLTIGTFEENIDNVLPKGKLIDLAFIDAIHTKEYVIPQLDMVVARSNRKAIIIIDDIYFSDDMKECWEEISNDTRFVASAAIGDRIGILELGKQYGERNH